MKASRLLSLFLEEYIENNLKSALDFFNSFNPEILIINESMLSIVGAKKGRLVV